MSGTNEESMKNSYKRTRNHREVVPGFGFGGQGLTWPLR